MLVPCMVKKRLKVWGESTCMSGRASWSRMSDASIPATTRKTRPEATYMIPSRLWSTVTIHSCRCSCHDRRAAIAGTSRVGDSTLMGSPQGQEVGRQLAQLVAGEPHRRHQHPGLDLGRVVQPGLERLGRAAGGAGGDGPPAHQMGEVGAEQSVGGGAAPR